MPTESSIDWQRDDTGVITLTMSDPTQRVNTLNDLFTRSFAAVVDRLEAERATITGVILQSGKPSFLAGGDLNRLAAIEPDRRQEFLDDLEARKARWRRLETFDRPVVAIIAGAAVGGGLELALACHHRIALDDSKVRLGLPEATLGLMPGGGGVVRLTRMLGLQRALPLMLSGRRLSATESAELGLLDELVDTVEAAHRRARVWITARPGATQPWDRPESYEPEPVAVLPPTGAALAPRTIADVAARSQYLDFDEALRIESAGLADLVISDQAKATIAVTFFDPARVRGRLRGLTGSVVPTLVGPSPLELTPSGAPPMALTLLAEADLGRGGELEGWLTEDVDGAGGFVLQYVAGAVEAALPALVKRGVLPVEVVPGRGSVAAALRAARVSAWNALVAQGFRPAELSAAAHWAGLEHSGERSSDAASELGLLLLDSIAVSARDAAGVLRHAEDFDLVSVRIGGFPAWTGGAGRWLAAPATRRRLSPNLTTEEAI